MNLEEARKEVYDAALMNRDKRLVEAGMRLADEVERLRDDAEYQRDYDQAIIKSQRAIIDNLKEES